MRSMGGGEGAAVPPIPVANCGTLGPSPIPAAARRSQELTLPRFAVEDVMGEDVGQAACAALAANSHYAKSIRAGEPALPTGRAVAGLYA
jgi:hypothetical protein